MSRDNQERPADSYDYELFKGSSSPRYYEDSSSNEESSSNGASQNVTESDGKHYRKKKKIPADVRERQRQARCGPPGREFANSEGFLPKIGSKENTWYEEFKVGEAREGDPGSRAGKRRIVQEVQGGEKRKVLQQYYTERHYNSEGDKRVLSFVERSKNN